VVVSSPIDKSYIGDKTQSTTTLSYEYRYMIKLQWIFNMQHDLCALGSTCSTIHPLIVTGATITVRFYINEASK
jgi:hypothetical protein